MVLLNGTVALCTGAARGLGRSTALLLAKHGAQVACVDMEPPLKTVDDIRGRGGGAESFVFDVTDVSAVSQLVHDVEDTFETPTSVLVNCAGITRDGFSWKMSEKDWDDVLSTNLKAPFMLSQAVSKRMLVHQQEHGNTPLYGSIVNISSIIGKVGNMGQANYAASKAGLVGLTKSMAKDLAKSNIRVNAVLPGFIETPMSAAVPEKVLTKFKQQIPLGEIGKPGDIAEAVLFLASSRSKYITGACLEVTGGLYM